MAAAAHEGWDSELFVEPPDEADLCGICCEVLEDAVETGCGHTFCDKCIQGWLKQRQVCPQDQNPLTWGDCRPMVRDRRRILDLKVRCNFDDCGKEMELRQLRDHQKACEHKPDDWEDPKAHLDDAADHEEKAEEKGDEKAIDYILELEPAVAPAAVVTPSPRGRPEVKQEDRREQQAKEIEDQDRAFALQMQLQEQERARIARAQSRQGPGQQQQQQQQQPLQPRHPGDGRGQQVGGGMKLHLNPEPMELAPANDEGGQYVDFGYQGDPRPEGYGGGVEGPEILRPPKKNRCCGGCSDKMWCCICCVFWIVLLAIGGYLWVNGIDSTKNQIGL